MPLGKEPVSAAPVAGSSKTGNFGTALFAGVGSMVDSIPGVARGGFAAFAGVGLMTAGTPTIRLSGVATFAGVGSMVDSISGVARSARATFAGAGAMTCEIYLGGRIPINATLAGAGSLTARATLLAQPRAAFDGVGALVPSEVTVRAAAATMAGSGSLSTDPQLLNNALFAGVGTLTVETRIPFQHAFGNFVGAGTLVVNTVHHLRVERHTGNSYLTRHAA